MGEDQLVELTSARSDFEAELIVGALKVVDITAVSIGGALSDEFAMSQKLMGLGGGVRVMVAESDLQRAQEALAELQTSREQREAQVDVETDGPHAEATDEPPAPANRSSPWKTVAVVLGLGCLGLGALAYYLDRKVPAADPLLESVPTAEGVDYRWRKSGQLHSRWFDRDANGIYEESHLFDAKGQLASRNIDNDQNGVIELVVLLDREGRESVRIHDPDQDGRMNQHDEYHGSSRVIRSIDREGDGRWEASEGRNATTDQVLWRSTVDPESGWTTQGK